MTAAALQALLEPVFLPGAAGAVFAVHYPPRLAKRDAAVIYLPPFAEEMNRARRMGALQARALAAAGYGALVLDPYGCGDSAGDFADARWDIWTADVRSAMAWLVSRGYVRIVLLGLRLGALLALSAAAPRQASLSHVVLWEPVLRGDQLVTQFLRLRLAGDLASTKKDAETTSSLRKILGRDGRLEIAGYGLSAALVVSLDALRLADLGANCPVPIDWVEIAASADQPSSPAQQDVLTRWQAAHVRARIHRAVGPPFWTLQETTLAPDLIPLTTALVGNCAA